MRRLLLIRHAEAAAAQSDVDRQLTCGGRAAAAKIGVYLGRTDLAPELALVSPARRTLQTFQEIEVSAGRGIPRLIAPALYNASASAIAAILEDAPAEIEVLLVIGHNPGLADIAQRLSRRGPHDALIRLRAQFPAPSLAVVAFEAPDWREACAAGGRLMHFITSASPELSDGADGRSP